MEQESQRPTVAVLGMGKMGRALARRLLDQGLTVVVWNRSPRDLSDLRSLGAVLLPSLGEVWSYAPIVITFLADDDALTNVCLDVGGVVRPGASGRVFIDMSTVSPQVSSEIATRAHAVGIAYLRSPVSGNPAVLAEGNLTLFVSGSRDTFERVEELMTLIGPNVLYVGDAEQARTLKLAINSGLAVTAQIVAELVVFGENSGIDRSVLLHALGVSVIGSPFVRYKSPALVAHDYSATFTTNHMMKDLGLALDVARRVELSLPAIELVATLTQAASAKGYGEIDFASLLPSLQLSLGLSPDVEPTPL